MKQLALGVALLLITLISEGQASNLNPSFSSPVPPSPDASAIQKFGSIPIGLSTGIPQINVPIYQYQNKASGLSMSISLDYHAGGIRVDEVASSIGLGWALNAGGMVTRVVKGIADECSDGFLNVPYFDPETGNNPVNAPTDKPFLKASIRRKDLEADIFSFNIGGKSGRFTYGRDGHIMMG